MDPTRLYALVSLILALSVASERLVEIAKGLWPWLNKAQGDARAQGRRRTVLLAECLAPAIWAYGALAFAILEREERGMTAEEMDRG